MPEEVFVIIALGIIASAGISIVKMILGYLSSKNRSEAPQGGMTASELRGMLKEAVTEANLPLESRISAIEDLLIEMPPSRQLEEKRRSSYSELNR